MSVVRRVAASLVFVCAAPALVGCGGYATPGRGADLSVLGVTEPAAARQTDATVAAALARQPLARFPTGIAVVRIQAPGYRSPTAEGWGRGAYSVVIVRDVEDPAQLDRLATLPGVHAIAPVGRLLLPQELHSDLELRNAAAKLHADVLLVYTLDTTFTVDDKAAPLSVVTLGLSPTQLARVVCTASAVLMDTRNGYVYGVAEGTARQGQLASAWTSASAVDDARRRAERLAFRNLIDELEATWAGVYHTYGRPQRLTPYAGQPLRQQPLHQQPVKQPPHGWEPMYPQPVPAGRPAARQPPSSQPPPPGVYDETWVPPSDRPAGSGAGPSGGGESWRRLTRP